jgi:CheY-like chemotaxis protein
MSKTEYYREHGQALAAVISLLREQWGIGGAEKRPELLRDTSPTALAEQEAREIGSRMQLEILDLRDIVRDVVGILDPLCHRQGIELQLWQESMPCYTQADRVALRQALLITIRTVMTAIASGRVGIQTTFQSSKVVVEIRGTSGNGRSSDLVPPDLIVARCLIGYLRGQLEVDSSDGVVVRIGLPTSRRSRLLVVDNNLDFVALISRYLNQENWEVIGASDARSSHEIIGSMVPDLVLLDVMMPGCDGWEFLRQIKSSDRTSEIPVLVCSVLNDEQLAMSLGANGYLLKPLSQSDLVQALRSWQVGTSEAGPEREELTR